MKYLYLFFFLVTFSFLTAQNADSLNAKSQTNATADSTKTKPKRTFNPIIMKAAIDSLVLNNRTAEPFVQLRQQIFMYHSGYHVATLPEQNIYMKDHGFTIRQSPFGLGYELQKRMAFSNYNLEGRSISFEEMPYPYPAALATSEFGIGGQDMNYAHLQIKKNELVGVDSLYGRFDALFQRGYWGGVSDNSTIENVFFKYALKQGNLQLHANSLDWDIPRFQYEIFRNAPGSLPIREKSVLMSLYLQNRLLNAGVQMSHVNWMSDSLSFGGAHNFWQILVDKEVEFNPLNLQFRYEHFGGAEIKSQYNQFITSPEMTDLGTFALNFDYKRTHFQGKIYGAMPKALGYDNELVYDCKGNNGIVLNVSGMKSHDLPEILYNPSTYTILFNRASAGYRIKTKFKEQFQFDIVFDKENAKYNDNSNSDSQEKDGFLDAIAQIPFTYHSINTWINYKMEFGLKLKSILDINTYYDLPYHNRILLGISHTFVEAVFEESFLHDMEENGWQIEEDYQTRTNFLDAYTGLQITKQFDIRFTVKNILNQEHAFNTSLLPTTYLLTVKWDFVN
jgi:hypothetical protein